MELMTSASQLHNYELVEFLGQGSTAQVYRAIRRCDESPQAKESVAIKAIDKIMVEQLQLESKVRRELVLHMQLPRHPHIVYAREMWEDKRHYYLVVEYCANGSLADYVQQKSHGGVYEADEMFIKRLFRQVVEGVCFLHSQGIIHRDLKLANLLMDNDGNVRISDFGLATLVSDEHVTVCGTPNFIAPEVLIAGDTDESACYDQSADIWSLGCVLYTLLLGSPPFQGSKVSETLQNIKDAAHHRLVFPPSFSASGANLIQRLLAVEPSNRPTASEILTHPWFKHSKAPASNMTSQTPLKEKFRFKSSPHHSRSQKSRTRRTRPDPILNTTVGSRVRKYDDDDPRSLSSNDSSSPRSIRRRGYAYSEDSIISYSDEEFCNQEEEASEKSSEEDTDGTLVSPELSIEENLKHEVHTDDPTVSTACPLVEIHTISLRIPINTLPFLSTSGTHPSVTSHLLEWNCYEQGMTRQITRFKMQVPTAGFEAEYHMSSRFGIVRGRKSDGTSFEYSTDKPDTGHSILRLCFCLTQRTLQLRRVVNPSAGTHQQLPLVQYDDIPQSLLTWLQTDSSILSVQEPYKTPEATAKVSNGSRSQTIKGVGTVYSNDDGSLKIRFTTGAILGITSDGAILRFRPSFAENEDTYDLLAPSLYLPTVVKQCFAHVPAFVRLLKTVPNA